MPQCCCGAICAVPDAPLGPTHKCLVCPESDNIVHAPCSFQVVRRGDVLVQEPNSDGTANQDEREFNTCLLSPWGAENAGHSMFGICKKCWEEHSRPPRLLDGTNVPMDVLATLFHEWLTGETSDTHTLSQLKHIFDGDNERARAYFRDQFVANARTQANGDRVAREGAFSRPSSGIDFASAFGAAEAQGRGPDPPIPARADLGVSVSVGGHVPSQLADARAKMTLDGIRNATRAKKTFGKRNGENITFILWLYDNKPAFLHDEFRQLLQSQDDRIDYDAFFRKRYRGKKTPEERRDNFRKDTLANVCKTVLRGLSEVGAVDLCLCLFDPLPP